MSWPQTPARGMLPLPRHVVRGNITSASDRRRRRRVEPTDEWERLLPLFEWPEQEGYEVIRPLVLFGSSVAKRAREVGTSERTLYRRVNRFEAEGMESLFDTRTAKRRRLPPAMRRLIVDLKAEYPAFNRSEIASMVYVRFGRRPDPRTVRGVLDEEPLPLRMLKRFAPYHEIPAAKERRMAVVKLHTEGRSAKAIAGPKPRALRPQEAEGRKAREEADALRLEETPRVLDGHRSPREVLGWVTGMRYREEDLERVFFSVRFSRVLDPLGYATFRRWRLYGEEALAGSQAELWLLAQTLTLEHAGEALSRYEVEHAPGAGRLQAVRRPALFETSRVLTQPRLFRLDALGEEGWLKVLRLEEYAPQRPRGALALQQALFSYTEAI
jgi:transposase